MTPREFEILTNQLLNTYGYTSINPRNRINGRGTTHQIDALGINNLTPTFSFPITLLAEAKYYRNDKIVGIGIIRNFFGVITDVKQNLPKVFTQPRLAGNTYINGTSNIIGLVISTVGYSSFAKHYAYAHGIFLVTLNFRKKNHSPLFGNFGGHPVIVQVPRELQLNPNIAQLRKIKLYKLAGTKGELLVENLPIQGSMKLIKKIPYFNKCDKEIEKIDVPQFEYCFLYDIKIPNLKSTFRTISQYEITSKTLLTLELPSSRTYLTFDLKIEE